MGKLKIALVILSMVINLGSVFGPQADRLNLPIGEDVTVDEAYNFCKTVVVRAKESGKTVDEYIEDGGNIPLFTCNLDGSCEGRFYIPDVGVNVALYDSYAQSVCDKKDSACLFNYASQRVIADHKHQGFSAIKKCKPGMIAYISDGERIERFICTEIIQGHNDGYLYDADYNDIEDRNPNGITCYTCNDHWRNITIVFFKKL